MIGSGALSVVVRGVDRIAGHVRLEVTMVLKVLEERTFCHGFLSPFGTPPFAC